MSLPGTTQGRKRIETTYHMKHAVQILAALSFSEASHLLYTRDGTLDAVWAQIKSSPGKLYGDIHSARLVLKK